MSQQTARKSVRSMWRRSLAIVVAGVLSFPVVASAVSLFSANASGIPAGTSLASLASQDNPFTFDAPAANVAKSKLVSSEIERSVATAGSRDTEVVVLDAWKYTLNRGPGGTTSVGK